MVVTTMSQKLGQLFPARSADWMVRQEDVEASVTTTFVATSRETAIIRHISVSLTIYVAFGLLWIRYFSDPLCMVRFPLRRRQGWWLEVPQ